MKAVSSSADSSDIKLALPSGMANTHAGPEGLNLTTHRSSASVWDRRGWDGSRERLALTRILVGVGGGALALQGVRQRTWTGRVLARPRGSPPRGGLTRGRGPTQARRWVDQGVGRTPGRPRALVPPTPGD